MEVWKDIKGYEGLYQVSDQGRVRSLDRYVQNGSHMMFVSGRCLNPSVRSDGYVYINLRKDKAKTFYVHRLVAAAFIPNPLGFAEVNHKDENKTNNTVENLEWVSRLYNSRYGTRGQRSAEKRRETSPCMKPVLQYTVDGVFVARHKSATKAALACGATGRYGYSPISKCANGKVLKAYGYTWRWDEK